MCRKCRRDRERVYLYDSYDTVTTCLRPYGNQALVAKCYKIRKNRLAKLENFAHICIMHGKTYHFLQISAQMW